MLVKKLLFSLSVFMFALITFITTTFAWFSLAENVSLDNIEMSVVTDEYLYLSLDGIKYSSTIKKEDLYKAIGYDVLLSDVTTEDGKTFYSSYDKTNQPIPNKGYISFILYAKTNNDTVDSLFLADNVTSYYDYATAEIQEINGTYAYSEGRNFKTSISFQYDEDTVREKDTTNKYFASDALRIGINELKCDNENLLVKDTRTNLSSFIYDISENKERGFGKLYGAYDFNKKKNPSFNLIPPNEPINTIYNLTTYGIIPYETNDPTSKCATFQEGIENGKKVFYAKIQVNIWLEGWDADCFNAILTDNILMQLKFRSAKLLTN